MNQDEIEHQRFRNYVDMGSAEWRQKFREKRKKDTEEFNKRAEQIFNPIDAKWNLFPKPTTPKPKPKPKQIIPNFLEEN
jgi:hypothetical protein